MRDGIQAIIFDVDGTLIEQISWVVLNLAMGVTKDEGDQLYADYHNGKIFIPRVDRSNSGNL